MAKLNRRSISRRTVEALKVEKDTVFWDRDLPGFGIRVYASGTKMYVVQSRTKGKSVRVTVGRHGVISADEARRRAARIVNRIKAGEDPIPEPLPARLAGGPTVAGLAARYMEKHVAVRCKASTAEGIRGLLGKYIVPEFGKLPLLAVERERVAAFHVRLNGVPYAANRAVALMSRMYAMAADWEMVPDGTNPCRSVRKYPARGRERFLTDTEFRRFGEVLGEAPTEGGVSVHAVAAIRLLMLTGCRKSEILSLQWTDIDLEAGELRLRDSKTGPRGAAVAAGGEGAGGPAPGSGQPLGNPRPEAGHAHDQPGRPVADRAGARGGRERQDSRLPAFLRVAGAGAGREPARDRQAARAQPDPDHRPVCASGAGFGQGRGGAGRRQHRGGFPDGRFGNGEAAGATGYGQSRVTSYRGTAGTAKRRQASSLSPRARRVTLSDAGKPGNIDFSEFVRWPVAERPITGKASRERIPVL